MLYTQANPDAYFLRQDLIHSFTSIGYSASLHYVPEHTRDGRDNKFHVEWFDVLYDVNEHNTTRITREQAFDLKPGAVCLVRCQKEWEYGDHFIVIMEGATVSKDGIMQKHIVIPTSGEVPVLEMMDGQDFVMLKLNDEMTKMLLDFHAITFPAAEPTFVDVYDLRYNEVTRMSTQEALYARRTDVMLVRSKSLPAIGDHYVVVTGHAVMKEHGMRPQTAVFPAMQNSPLLDAYDSPGENVVILKLNNEATQAFLNFYGIHLDEALNVVSETTELVMV
jgi:hypothetical protein